MSFFKKSLGAATGIATGGLYSTEGGGLLQGGGLDGMVSNATGFGFAKDTLNGERAPNPNDGLDIYNQGLTNQAKVDATAKKNQYYGNTLDNLGKDTEDYTARLKGNLDKNVAKADLYNQQAGQQRALDNARAGLSGVDTSAMNEQARRTASFGAATINENAKRDALDLYGKSIGNKIEGASQIDNSQMALAISQMKLPQAQNKPGLIGGLLGGFV